MELIITDDQIGRYFRRRQLGLRMLAHGARPQTVLLWTGLTEDQLLTLRRRWAIGARPKVRGPSPSSFDVFFTSAKVSNMAAVFACLCQLVGAIPWARGKDAAARLPSIENGELLCETLEMFKEWFPDVEFSFEQAALLAQGVVEEKAVRLVCCVECGAATLVDLVRPFRATCTYCRKRGERLAG